MNCKFITALLTTAVVLSAGVVGAQTYDLNVDGPASVGEGVAFDASVTLDFTGADPTSGWSYGICNDTAFVTLTGIADGVIPMTAKNGDPVDFNQQSMGADGYSVGLVICLVGCATLAPGTDYDLTTGSYTADLETPTTTSITPCDTIGAPPVATVVVVNGQSIVPTFGGLDLAIVGVPEPAYTYLAPMTDVNYNPDTGGDASVTISVSVDQDDNGAPSALTQGFSMGLGHDASILEVTAVNTAGLTAALGQAPDFATVGLDDVNGWTIGVVYALTGGVEIPLDNTSVLEIDYQTVTPSPLAGDTVGLTSSLTWSDNIGAPPVANVVVVGGASLNATFTDGSFNFIPQIITIVEFRRGDANEDGIVNIADGIWILNDLFQGGPSIDCDAASDANGDGNLDSADAVYIFSYRFMGGSPPPAPFPDCGTFPGQLPAPDDCNAYNGC